MEPLSASACSSTRSKISRCARVTEAHEVRINRNTGIAMEEAYSLAGKRRVIASMKPVQRVYDHRRQRSHIGIQRGFKQGSRLLAKGILWLSARQ
jgi:hypothetical protein